MRSIVMLLRRRKVRQGDSTATTTQQRACELLARKPAPAQSVYSTGRYAQTMLLLGSAASPWISTPWLVLVPNVSIVPPFPSDASCSEP